MHFERFLRRARRSALHARQASDCGCGDGTGSSLKPVKGGESPGAIGMSGVIRIAGRARGVVAVLGSGRPDGLNGNGKRNGGANGCALGCAPGCGNWPIRGRARGVTLGGVGVGAAGGEGMPGVGVGRDRGPTGLTGGRISGSTRAGGLGVGIGGRGGSSRGMTGGRIGPGRGVVGVVSRRLGGRRRRGCGAGIRRRRGARRRRGIAGATRVMISHSARATPVGIERGGMREQNLDHLFREI